MIPILYAKDETTFTTHGIGDLKDCIKAVITEERNGAYELSMQYPITGDLYPQIAEGCVVKVKANETSNPQLFRIYSSTKPINGIVIYSAEHISYDLNGLPLAGFTVTNSTAQAAINTALSETPFNNSFSVLSDIATLNNTNIKMPCSVRGILGGQEGSVLDVWGGEYEFDNYVIKLHQHRGSDNGVTVEYGKNLTDIEQERNITDTYTHLMPYAVYSTDNGDGTTTENYVYLDEKVLAFSGAENIGHQKALIMDFSDEYGENETPTQTTLRTKANAYISAHTELGVPKVNLTVSFVQLWQTEEYKNIAPLERVSLCDTVTVRFANLGVSAKAKVIETVYDSLNEKYETITLGDAKSNFADSIVKYTSEITEVKQNIKNRYSKAVAQWQKAIDDATAAITGIGESYVVINHNSTDDSNEILIMDNPDISLAQKIWRWNLGGLGYSNQGYNGPYTTAMTMNGQIVADFISTGSLDGGLITAGSIDADSINATNMTIAFNKISSYVQMDSNGFYLRDSNNHDIATLGYMAGLQSPILQFLDPLTSYVVGCELTDIYLRFFKGFYNNRVAGAYYGKESIEMHGGSISTQGGLIDSDGGDIYTKNGDIRLGTGKIHITSGNTLEISGGGVKITSGAYCANNETGQDSNEYTLYLPTGMTTDGKATGWIRTKMKFTKGILTTWVVG